MIYFIGILSLLPCFLISVQLSTFVGTAYNEKKEHLFTEEYFIQRENDKIISITTKFSNPEGKFMGELCASFSDSPFLPEITFTTNEGLIRYGTSKISQSIEVFHHSLAQVVKKKTLPVKESMVAGPGFYLYIIDRLDDLLAGKPGYINFVQPNRLNSYCFKMQAHKETEERVSVQLVIDNAFLKAFVPEIKIVLNPKTKTLISYEGLSGFLHDDGRPKKISVHYSQPIEIESGK